MQRWTMRLLPAVLERARSSYQRRRGHILFPQRTSCPLMTSFGRSVALMVVWQSGLESRAGLLWRSDCEGRQHTLGRECEQLQSDKIVLNESECYFRSCGLCRSRFDEPFRSIASNAGGGRRRRIGTSEHQRNLGTGDDCRKNKEGVQRLGAESSISRGIGSRVDHWEQCTLREGAGTWAGLDHLSLLPATHSLNQQLTRTLQPPTLLGSSSYNLLLSLLPALPSCRHSSKGSVQANPLPSTRPHLQRRRLHRSIK